MKTFKFIWHSRKRMVFFPSVLLVLFGPLFAFKNPESVLPSIGVALLYASSFLMALVALEIWVSARSLQAESAKHVLSLLTEDEEKGVQK
jgi:hypothetical protein